MNGRVHAPAWPACAHALPLSMPAAVLQGQPGFFMVVYAENKLRLRVTSPFFTGRSIFTNTCVPLSAGRQVSSSLSAGSTSGR